MLSASPAVLSPLAPVFPAPLLAHVTRHAGAADSAWWAYWNFDPLIIANLSLLAACYAAGYRRLRGQRGSDAPVRPAHAAAFAAGLLFVVIALISPIDVFALELLSVHMIQHMILMNLAAPLVVVAAPVRTMLWVLPPSWRQRAGRGRRRLELLGFPRRLFQRPVFLWLVYAAVLWAWHLPRLYESALHHEWVHDAQHLMFFGASCLFWGVMLDPVGRLRMSRGLGVVYLFTTSLHATLLGVFMALAPSLWYETYAGRTAAWGLTALEDQQLAGYIMWMPACMAYAAVAAIVFGKWIHQEAARDTAQAAGRPMRP